jgi:hypothetical protein
MSAPAVIVEDTRAQMLYPFFALAMLAPNRQRSFRSVVVMHAVLVSSLALAVMQSPAALAVAAQVLLIAGIVEGATLVGWRLTQLPKSQALEFLLVSPVQPKAVYHCEAAVGLARLALITLAGLPILVLLVLAGRLVPEDVPVLVIMPLTWGAIARLGLTAWAYESRAVRRWGEFVTLGGIVLYLIVGVLAGENLRLWVTWLPDSLRWWVLELFAWGHIYNPFAVMHYWFDPQRAAAEALNRMIGVESVTLGVLGLVALRGAARLRGHFHDRHYRPLTEVTPDTSGGVGDKPLAWWAVRRVMEYSGRVNLWLAGGFGLLYAAYTVAGDHWPPWLGRLVFQLVENAGGIPALAAGLAVLAAVPACFQYGLWDSSAQDRCRRLELLLLTELNGTDYWDAAAAAAWRRGRGYFAVAVILWLAAGIAGRAGVLQVLAAMSAAVIVWGFSFVLGFRAFARGRQANGLGSLLTLGLPLLTVALTKMGCLAIAALTPPGSICYALLEKPAATWATGPFVYGTFALVVGRIARHRCDRDLRAWYDKNSGRQMAD